MNMQALKESMKEKVANIVKENLKME